MITRDLPGAELPSQQIDLFPPTAASAVVGGSGGRDAGQLGVFHVHGGGWYAGARDSYHAWAAHAAGLGLPSASTGYRIEPGSSYRDKMTDVVAGLRVFAAEFDDLAGVCLVGSSAGAHLVTALALTGVEPWLPADVDPAGLPPVVGVHAANGPGSMRPESLLQAQQRLTEMAMTDEEIQLLDRPVVAPPMEWLFLLAERETYFPHEHVAGLSDRLTVAGHDCETVVVPDTDHGFVYGVLKRGGEAAEVSTAAVEAFLARVQQRMHAA
ncbi:alpha/beta hydrolase [Microlunatus sp. Y2014]|uniref:alpha/beta hydrolase n=1 Tax=Microlunatus sp. Y2014 TaxID=3418488 RepID=UPI003DA7451E